MKMTYYELERKTDAARQLRAETLGGLAWVVSALTSLFRALRRPLRLLAPLTGARKA